jgi:hypothetical protein
MFAPVQDREVSGQGFTHKMGDVVTISSDKLGVLVNQVVPLFRCRALGFRHCEFDAQPSRSKVDLTALRCGTADLQR